MLLLSRETRLCDDTLTRDDSIYVRVATAAQRQLHSFMQRARDPSIRHLDGLKPSWTGRNMDG